MNKGLLLLLLLLLLGACKKQSIDSPEPQPTPSVPTEVSKEVIKLSKPIVLEIGVTQPSIMDGTHSSATRSFSRDYNSNDRLHASVNTTDKTKVNTGDPKLDELIKKSWFSLQGYDYINTLHIPELNPEDYKVEGLVPRQLTDSSGNAEVPGSIDSSKPIPSKVTITLYSIPLDGTLTFLANARLYQSYYNRSDNIGYLSLENPYIVSLNSSWQLADKVLKEYKQAGNRYDLGKSSHALFEQNYIPMYGRLYNVTPNANKDGIKASETPNGTPEAVQTIYMERAVSFVYVTWEHEQSTNYLKPYPGWWYYSGEYVIESVHRGLYCNLCSILPNNWSGVSQTGTTKMRNRVPKDKREGYLPFYSHIINEGTQYGESPEAAITALQRAGYQTFFVAENFPTKKEDQNTIYIQMSKFRAFEDPNQPTYFAYEYVGERKKYKFDLPYGEKNGTTGLLDIHRNTFYHLHIKIKQTEKGFVPYIANNWTEIDIPAEL